MGLFKNKNKEPSMPASAPTQAEAPSPIAGNLHPVTEGERLNLMIDQLVTLQKGFLADCKQKGIDAADTSRAILDAMKAGAHPSAISLQPRRNRDRDLYLLHGNIPEGVIQVDTNAVGDLVLSLGENPDGIEWPSQPDQEDPSSFYIEQYHVVHTDEIPVYGDETIDLPAAQGYRTASEQLSRMIN